MEQLPKQHENVEGEMKIHGYSVFFPAGRKPFPAQLAVISKVLQALKEKKNALLESPTGTGKVLNFMIFLTVIIYIDCNRVILDSGVSCEYAGIPTSVQNGTDSNRLVEWK